MKFFIIERTPGNAFTTARRNGEAFRVPIGKTRIGPFPSIPAAADWLSLRAFEHSSYEIECEQNPENDGSERGSR